VLSQGRVVQSVTTRHLTFDAIKIDTSSGKTISDALAYYRSLPEVEDVRPDGIVHALGVSNPNDPDYSWQWDFQQLSMPNVWTTTTGTGVIVAVVDTGLYRPLADSPTSIQLGYNAITQTADTSGETGTALPSSDDNGHGTQVSSTIAEATNNDVDCAGMAYGVTLLPVKVLDYSGSGYWSDVAAGIEWAISQTPMPAVINLSLGGSPGDPSLLQAVEDAYNAGVAVIAAAGNESLSSMDYPAAYQPFVLSVGATGYNKELAYYSNYGSQLDVVAPGGDDTAFSPDTDTRDWIWQETINGWNGSTTHPVTDYADNVIGYEGTSMATPHVSALAALLVSQNSSLTPAQIYNRIELTADNIGAANTFGSGLIDPLAALGVSGIIQIVTGPVQVITPPSYTFTAASSSAVKFDASLNPASGSLTLKLYDSGNNLLQQSSSGSPPVLSYAFASAGTYRIEVDYTP
jgi:serine protease